MVNSINLIKLKVLIKLGVLFTIYLNPNLSIALHVVLTIVIIKLFIIIVTAIIK